MKITALLGALVLLGCASTENNWKKVGNLEEAFVFHKAVYTAQPNEAALRELKDKGVKTIINLRAPSEDRATFNREKKLARELGMTFHNIPMTGKEFSPEAVDEVYKVYKEAKKDGRVLLHCSSGNRAAAWLGAHLFRHDGFSKEKSMSIAKSKGLNKDEIENRLDRFFDTTSDKK